MIKTTSKILIVSCACLLGSYSLAAEKSKFEQFYEQQNSAYSSYRTALFQTNKKDQAASLKGLNSFSKQWDIIVNQFSSNPPEIFASDAEWTSTLTKIAKIAETSRKEITAGKLAEAHETLEAIRDELSNLRSRNHLVFFSDHVNSYHEVMENLLLSGYTEKDINANTQRTISEQLAVLEFLAERIVKNAPDDYQSNKTYLKLQDGLQKSLNTLRGALNSGDSKALVKGIKGLKPAYAKLFAKFG